MPLSLTIVRGRPRILDETVEFADDTPPGERRIGHQRQAFPGEVVDHDEHPEASAVRERAAITTFRTSHR